MIDQDFCDFLEYEICKALMHSGNTEIKGFWCDGVTFLQSYHYNSKTFVNENKEIKLKTFIGKDGQTEYELTLKFGNRALGRFAKNLDLKACVLSPEKQNWFNIDTKRNKISIQLD